MIKIVNYINEIEKKVSIEEGIIAIEQFLINVYFENPISNKELARRLYLPIPLVVAIKKEFIKVNILKQDKGISITSKGKDYVENDLGYKGINKMLFKNLNNCVCNIEETFREEIQIMKEIFSKRPKPDLSIDQTHCTYMTSLKRSILSLRYNTLINKKILCIGDDDLVSISLGLLLKKIYQYNNKNKSEIHVIDIDNRYLNYIDKISSKYDLPITCHKIDLRNNIDKELINKFDCFYTDPPYTINGLNLFLSKGISALKNTKGLPIFLSFAPKSYDYSFKMMKKFIEMGITIYRIFPKFNVYEGAGIIGNMGQLLILNTTSYTNADIKENLYYKKCLYTHDVKKMKTGSPTNNRLVNEQQINYKGVR